MDWERQLSNKPSHREPDHHNVIGILHPKLILPLVTGEISDALFFEGRKDEEEEDCHTCCSPTASRARRLGPGWHWVPLKQESRFHLVILSALLSPEQRDHRKHQRGR